MMWTTSLILLLLTHLLSSTGSENSSSFNQSESLNDDIPVKASKSAGSAKGWDTCSIPCDITVKLLRDEKHSICVTAVSVGVWA